MVSQIVFLECPGMQGVRADHAEFAYLDGQPGTRVKPAWGYLGESVLWDVPEQYLLLHKERRAQLHVVVDG